MNTYRQVSIKFSLLATIALGLWLLYGTSQQHLQVQKTQAINPDSFAEQIHVTQFNDDGSLREQLFSPKVIHYLADDLTNITTPNIIYYVPNKPVWTINSEYGQSRNAYHTIELWDHVTLHQAASKDKKETALFTHHLNYFPKQDRAYTQAQVTLEQPGVHITAKGMQAFLTEQRIQLLSQARGRYDPTL